MKKIHAKQALGRACLRSAEPQPKLWKKLPGLLLLSLFTFPLSAQTFEATDSLRHEVLIETTRGNLRVALFNDTPIHRDNFLKRVEDGFYTGLLFHRVIPEFVIQAGDSLSRFAEPGQPLGDTPEAFTLPAEILYPTHLHLSGALGMAREDDEVNPERASSSCQFYIVTGRRYTEDQLDKVQERLDEYTGGLAQLTDQRRELYRTVGGAPHLDGQYTVFGELVEGFETLDEIQFNERDELDRPLEDIRIIKATVVK